MTGTTPPPAAIPRPARVGVGGTDIERAARFYDALGFDVGPVFDLGTAIGEQSLTPGVPLRIRMARRDGMTVELLQHGETRPAGPPVRRPMRRPGLTHLALVTDDLDRAAGRIAAAGGTVFDFTRATDGPGRAMVFCADPSGVRLLLLTPQADVFGGPEPGADGLALHSIGLTVANLGRTTRFWTGIGFHASAPDTAAGPLAQAAELPGTAVRRRRFTKDGFRFDATQWGAARTPVPVMEPLNRGGDLVHLGTHCDDFPAALRLAASAGGTVVERTRGVFPPPGLEVPGGTGDGPPHGWVFVLDPDGVSIEIVGPSAGHP